MIPNITPIICLECAEGYALPTANIPITDKASTDIISMKL